VPDETKLYSARVHARDIGFAKTVEPDNTALKQREARDQRLRAEGKPTLPSTLARKKANQSLLRLPRARGGRVRQQILGARIAGFP